MTYFQGNGYTIIKKHFIIVILLFIKALFVLLLGLFIFFISIEYRAYIGEDFAKYIFFPLVFFLVNYSIIKLVLGLIEHYNYLFIIKDDQIFVINCSLILRDDIEVIDSFKIIKVDSFSRGFISNIIGYGTIVIELQGNEETRSFTFMPKPYKLIKKLEEQRNQVLLDRKKKYIAVAESGGQDIKPLEVNVSDKITGILNVKLSK